MKRLPHQDVGSWGQKGRSGHQDSLDFKTPFRLANNYFIATSHGGKKLAPRLMALYDTGNSCHTKKKGISDDQDVRIWGQKERSGHQKSLYFQTPIRLAHNHFIQLHTGAKCKRRGS
jgi:hypothetical protein